MGEALVALRAELTKARRLRLVWTLLALMLLMVGLNSAVSYQAYQDVRRYAAVETRQAPQEQRRARAMQQEGLALALRANLVMPTAYAGVTGVIYFPGLVLMSIGVATLVGGEFGWGTVQRALARGRRRWVVVWAKLALVVIMAGVGVAAGLVAGSLGGIWTSHLVGAWRPESLSGQVWKDLGVMFVRLWAVLGVYGASAAAAGFLFRSAGLGVAAALVYHFLEALVSGLIVQSRGWMAAVRPYLLGNVTHSLVVNHNPFVTGLVSANGMAMESAHRLDPTGAWVALGVWGAAFVAIAFASFVRRDLQV